jgi:sialic acid synthase SpsE
VREKLAKSIVTRAAIAGGTVIESEALTTKGPGSGISPARLDEVVGRTAARDLEADQILRWEDLR